jgi:predicted MFS family arabinose efflux permease
LIARVLDTYRAAFRGLSREIWGLALVSLVNRSGTMVVLFLVPWLTRVRGFEPAVAGNLLSVYGLGTVAGIWLGGRLTDRIGHRPVIEGSLLLTGITMLVLGTLREPLAIGAGVAALGLVGEAIRPANAVAVVAHSEEAGRPRAFGLMRLSVNLGLTLGPALGGFLASIDYAWLFRVDGGTCLLAALLFRLLFPREEADEPEARSAARSGPSPWRDGLFVAALGLLMLQALIFFQLWSTYPLYLLEQRGFSERVFGGLFAVNTAVIVVFEMVLVHSIERRDPLRVIAVASLLIGAGFGLTAWVESLPAVVLTVLIWTLGEMLGAPMMQSWVARRARPDNRGRYLAGFAMVFSVSSVLAPWFGTRVYQNVSPDAVWHACLLLGALQFLGFAALSRVERRTAASSE